MTFYLRNMRNRVQARGSSHLTAYKHLIGVIGALAISLALIGCALTRSPRLDEPEPFKPNTSSINEPIRSAMSLIPMYLDSETIQSDSDQYPSPANNQKTQFAPNLEDKTLPLVYLLKVAEPIRAQLKFPSGPVMLAAMKSCGKISESSRNEGFVRQLFVGWKGAKGVSVRSLEIQGQRVAIAKGRGDIAGAPVSLLALSRRYGSCVFDLTIWSEDQSLLELSSEAISSLGTALITSHG